MPQTIFDGHNDLLLRLSRRSKESDIDTVIKQCITGDNRIH